MGSHRTVCLSCHCHRYQSSNTVILTDNISHHSLRAFFFFYSISVSLTETLPCATMSSVHTYLSSLSLSCVANSLKRGHGAAAIHDVRPAQRKCGSTRSNRYYVNHHQAETRKNSHIRPLRFTGSKWHDSCMPEPEQPKPTKRHRARELSCELLANFEPTTT